MGAVGVIILSFVLLFAYSGISHVQNHFAKEEMTDHYLRIPSEAEIGRVLSWDHEYEPPARKAVAVDISGMSHPSADGSHLTRRDRSRKLPRSTTYRENNFFSKIFHHEALPPKFETDVKTESGLSTQVSTPLEPVQMPAPAAATSMAVPTSQERVDEPAVVIPQAQPVRADIPKPLKLTLARRVQMALMTDPGLSRAVRSSIRVRMVNGKVTLTGVVFENEKEYITAKVDQIAGSEKVDNRLRAL